ncbi:hypothetical protein ACJX0J_022476, partial [Zea mays]
YQPLGQYQIQTPRKQRAIRRRSLHQVSSLFGNKVTLFGWDIPLPTISSLFWLSGQRSTSIFFEIFLLLLVSLHDSICICDTLTVAEFALTNLCLLKTYMCYGVFLALLISAVPNTENILDYVHMPFSLSRLGVCCPTQSRASKGVFLGYGSGEHYKRSPYIAQLS